MLQWARKYAGLTADDVARSVSVSTDRYLAWERGDAHPTFRQARMLANVLRVPFGYLFLESPPEMDVQIPDLRTIGSVHRPQAISLELRDIIEEVLLKQDWYREYRESHGATPLDFVGRFDLNSDPLVVARSIRQRLDINESLRAQARSSEEYLRAIVERAESLGILVFRNSIVGNDSHRALSVEEFRGFAISDPIAPVVFINTRDSKTAQVFTLVHELAHLWYAQSGISSPRLDLVENDRVPLIERLCNMVAAEVLVPRRELLQYWDEHGDILSSTQRLSRRFHVSTLVIIRRAYDLGRLSRSVFLYWYHKLSEESQSVFERQDRQSDGGNFYRTLLARHSRRFTETLVGAVMSGEELITEAARLLSVRPSTIPQIWKKLREA